MMEKKEYMRLMSQIWDYNKKQHKDYLSAIISQNFELNIYWRERSFNVLKDTFFTDNPFYMKRLTEILNQKEPVSPKNLTREELLLEYDKLVEKENFGDRYSEIASELNRRNRATIYKTACKVLKNRGINQFKAAHKYANSVLNGNEYFCTDDHHEIDGFYTKSGNPVVVWFDN